MLSCCLREYRMLNTDLKHSCYMIEDIVSLLLFNTNNNDVIKILDVEIIKPGM